jgi:apolipoprotein N-acyltransferase
MSLLSAFLSQRTTLDIGLMAFILGMLSSLAMAPTFYWPFLLLGLSGLFVLVSTQNFKNWHCAFIFAAFAFGYFLLGLYWIGNALLIGGSPFTWVYPLAILGLPFLLSLFWFGVGYFYGRFFQTSHLTRYCGFVFVVALAEYLRGILFTGFPWNQFGHAFGFSLEMLQIISVTGIDFLNAVSVFLFSAPALFLFTLPRKHKITIGLSALAVLLSLFVFGSLRLGSYPTQFHSNVILHIVTPNIAQEDKWNPEKIGENFFKTTALSTPQHLINPLPTAPDTKRLLIYPETALHLSVFESAMALRELHMILNLYSEQSYLLAGALRRINKDGENIGYGNSLIVMEQDGRITENFDKFHLVPFGEYIPFSDIIPLAPLVGFEGFIAGDGPRNIALSGIPVFSPLVCYEVIFSGRVVDPSDQHHNAQWMVNVTNDAWYGQSPGPYQHLLQTQLRAIEESIPMVRSTNTGISAIFDPVGRELSRSPLDQEFVQELYLPKELPNKGLYAQLSQAFKPLFIYGFLAFLASFCLILALRHRSR